MGKKNLETIKANSQGLGGALAVEIDNDDVYLSEAAKQISKFHGIYQQRDRDVSRRDLKPEHYSFMLRTKVPGGQLSTDQYLIHDRLADLHGNGTLRLTTRQTVQFHGIIKGDLRDTIRGLHSRLITSLGACGDIVRNVMACSAPTADPQRKAVQDFAETLSAELTPQTAAYHQIWLDGERMVDEAPVNEPLYGETYLPRKFKIGIAFEGDNCVDVYTQDIGLVALFDDNDQLTGFNVLVGGGMGQTHNKEETFARLGDLIGFVTADQVIELTKAIVTIHRDYGNRQNRRRARLKYVLHEWGAEKFTQVLQERLSFDLQPARPMPELVVDDHLGWHDQGHGRLFYGVHVENGRIADRGVIRLRTGIRTVVEQFGVNVRLTPQQNLLLVDIDPANREQIETVLADHGIRTLDEISAVRRLGIACPALPTCGLAITEAERIMPDLLTEVEETLADVGLDDEPIAIRMTGCPNGCSRPYVAEIAFVGRSLEKYKLYLGGAPGGTRLARPFQDLVHADDLVPTLRPILAHYRDHRYEDEAFGDFVARVGFDRLRNLVLRSVNSHHVSERVGEAL